MGRRESASVGLLMFLCAVIGCGRSTPEQSLVKKVNADNKGYKAEWVYETRMGEQFGYREKARMEFSVSGRKFHLTSKPGHAVPQRDRRSEEFVHDGKVLFHLIPSQKQVNQTETRRVREIPFWKMPDQMRPFGPPKEVGEGEVAGRRCRVLEITGKYDQGDVTLTYWIDKEKSVLLKKEHLLKAADLTLANEIYECKKIEFVSSFPPSEFEATIPADWVIHEKTYLTSDLLDTKF